MRQSQLFTKTKKTTPKDETSLNAQYLIKAGFIDKLMAGVYTMLPLGWKVYKKIEQIIREEIDAIGGLEMYMPTLQPKENWQRTKRWDDMDVLFKLPVAGNKELVLGPTHEEVIAPLLLNYISSYKDLPTAVYHIQNKFRNEKRAKSGLLRGREFMMKDLYSFHTDEQDLDIFYEKAAQAYMRIFDRTGIGQATYKTYASGGTFSRYSHEFQTLTEAGEDIIYICDNCRIGVNKEIIRDQKNQCPLCGNSDLRQAKAVEVGNIFKLGTKFSQPFNLCYKDKKGEEKLVVMGCYGIGLQRLMGTIVEVCNDKKGIIWPSSVAPFRLHLLSLNKNAEADKLYRELTDAGVEVLYDDRQDSAPGEKFADADLIGCPLRAVLSEKTIKENSIEIKKRGQEETKLFSIKELAKSIQDV